MPSQVLLRWEDLPSGTVFHPLIKLDAVFEKQFVLVEIWWHFSLVMEREICLGVGGDENYFIE